METVLNIKSELMQNTKIIDAPDPKMEYYTSTLICISYSHAYKITKWSQ